MSDIQNEIQDENIITLTDDEGNDVEFFLLDVVEYKDEDYMVMIPLDGDDEDDEEEDEDEVVILKVIHDGDEEIYSGVEDEETLNAVFEIFQEQNAEEDED